MDKSGKVIYVDFKAKAKGGSFSPGPRFTVTAAVIVLILLVCAVALFSDPGFIYSGFFAPTVILVSVLIALMLKKLVTWWQVNKLHREFKKVQNKQDERVLH